MSLSIKARWRIANHRHQRQSSYLSNWIGRCVKQLNTDVVLKVSLPLIATASVASLLYFGLKSNEPVQDPLPFKSQTFPEEQEAPLMPQKVPCIFEEKGCVIEKNTCAIDEYELFSKKIKTDKKLSKLSADNPFLISDIHGHGFSFENGRMQFFGSNSSPVFLNDLIEKINYKKVSVTKTGFAPFGSPYQITSRSEFEKGSKLEHNFYVDIDLLNLGTYSSFRLHKIKNDTVKSFSYAVLTTSSGILFKKYTTHILSPSHVEIEKEYFENAKVIRFSVPKHIFRRLKVLLEDSDGLNSRILDHSVLKTVVDQLTNKCGTFNIYWNAIINARRPGAYTTSELVTMCLRDNFSE